MTEEQNNRLGHRISPRHVRAILVVGVPAMAAIISIVLAVQLQGLKREMRDMHEEVTSLQAALGEVTVPENGSDMQELIDGDVIQNAQANENRIVYGYHKTSEYDKTGIRKVYLTFDDGPSANTDKILDILDEYGVKATFFVVGKDGYNDQYRRIVEGGHTLGMHSYSHRYRDIYQSLDAYREDLEKLHTYLYELTGVDSRIVRFPGGSSNVVSEDKIQDMIAYLAEEGITYYDWNVSSGDAASGYVSARRLADNVLNNVDKFNTVIVLMHDASDKDTTVEALPIIIEKILESDNTVLLPISENTVPIQHIKAE